MNQVATKTMPVLGSGTNLVEMLERSLMPKKLPVTHCTSIMCGARKGIKEGGFEFSDLYYTASGMTAKVVDPRDGQEYLLEIRPVD